MCTTILLCCATATTTTNNNCYSCHSHGDCGDFICHNDNNIIIDYDYYCIVHYSCRRCSNGGTSSGHGGNECRFWYRALTHTAELDAPFDSVGVIGSVHHKLNHIRAIVSLGPKQQQTWHHHSSIDNNACNVSISIVSVTTFSAKCSIPTTLVFTNAITRSCGCL
jgi:hypothetical protein